MIFNSLFAGLDLKRLGLILFAVLALLILALTLGRGFNSEYIPQAEARPAQSGSWQASTAVTNMVFLPALFREHDGSLSQVTPEKGGTVASPGGQVTVTVPPGAVSGVTTVNVSRSSVSPPLGVSDIGLVMEVEAVGPDAQPVSNLARSTTLQFNYSALDLSFVAESSLTIYHRGSDGEWTSLPTVLDTANRTATATATQFSPFGLFGSPMTEGMPTGVAIDAQGNAYWVDFTGFSIRKASPGVQVSTVYYDLRTVTTSMLGDAGDLDVDRATGTLYFTDGDRVWRITPDRKATAIYSRDFDLDAGAVPGDSVNGLYFDARNGTLYVATKSAIIQLDPKTGNRLGTFASSFSSVSTFQDVVVDSRGRMFAVTTDAPRGTVTFSGWGNMYYWGEGSGGYDWLPVAYGFAGPRGLAADKSGNVFVANLLGDVISVVSGADPSVTGFLRNVRRPRGIAVSGDTLVVAAYDSIFAFPRTRRDAPAAGLSVSLSPGGSMSGQGSVVTVSVSGYDPIPAHNVLRVGSTVVHEMVSFASGTIRYQLPIAYGSNSPYDPTLPVRLLTVPSGAYRFSIGTTLALDGSLTTPDLGYWEPGTWPNSGVLKIPQHKWLVWTGPILESLESLDNLFPKWDSSKGAWLAYQFNANGRFTFRYVVAGGQTLTVSVEVTRAGPGNRGDVFRVDPVAGGMLYSQGARLEIPAGALPGTGAYTVTVGNAVGVNPSPNALSSLSYRYSFAFSPEPSRLIRDIVFRLPCDQCGGSEPPPQAAFFDSALGDFVHLEATTAGGYINLNMQAGEYSASSISQAGVGASVVAPPGTGAPVGQKLRAALNTVGSSLWWVVGLPNKKVEDDNFVVLWHTGDGTTDAYGLKLLDALGKSRSLFKSLGYAVPSSKVIVKTAPWVTRITDSEGFAPGIGTLLNWYMFFNDKLTEDEIEVTAAHEFFHILQMENMSYSARHLAVPKWWREGTATWAEYAVFPDRTNFHLRMAAGGDFVQKGYDNWTALDANQEYATVAFAIYLSEKKGAGAIKDVFSKMGLLTGFNGALREVVGSLDTFFDGFLKDYWMQNFGPAKAWGLELYIANLELNSPSNTVVNNSLPHFSSGLNRVYYSSKSNPNPPASFNEASGSVSRVPQPCTGAKVYVLDSTRSQVLAQFVDTDEPGSGQVLDKLGNYTLANPLYFLYVSSSNLASPTCTTKVLLETPTILRLLPDSILVSQSSTILIVGGGFGSKPGQVSVGVLNDWKDDGIAISLNPPATGDQTVTVENADRVNSNSATLHVVAPTPTPIPPF